jgi:hypothetical protein
MKTIIVQSIIVIATLLNIASKYTLVTLIMSTLIPKIELGAEMFHLLEQR